MLPPPMFMPGAGPMFLVTFIHAAGALAVFMGVVLFLMWAYKHMPAAEMKKWAIGLIVGGAVACLLTVVIGAKHGKMKVMMHRDGDVMMMRGPDGESMMGGAMMIRESSSEGASSSAN